MIEAAAGTGGRPAYESGRSRADNRRSLVERSRRSPRRLSQARDQNCFASTGAGEVSRDVNVRLLEVAQQGAGRWRDDGKQ